MDATRQIFQVSKLPDTLSFFIIPGMFQWNLTEVGQIYTPDKFAQSICISPKIKREILAYKRLQTTRPCQETISLPETANQWDNRTSWLHWQWIKIFWEKVNHERHIFWSRSLSGALILDDKILGKVAKSNEKTSAKMESKGACGQLVDKVLNSYIFVKLLSVN